MQGDFVDVGGTRLFVRRWGPPGGRPILFFHSLGSAASAALIHVGMGPLENEGYAIAAPDMPGFGESPPIAADAYEVSRLAELGVALADALGWERFVLAGHSWGGAIATHVAAAHPERVGALVLVDSGHLDYADDPNGDINATLDETIADAESKRIRIKDRATVASDLELDVDDPVVESFMAGLTDDGEGGLISRTQGTSRGPAQYHLMRARQTDQWPAIAAAETPVLLLLATLPDSLRATNEVAGARFKTAVPQADVRYVEGATHSLITDLRDDFGATVAAWLGTVR